MKKHITSKLTLSKDTLRHLSDRDLSGAVGGHTLACEDTTASICEECPTDSCISNGDPCLTRGHHCC